jgi:hypothetical protein
LNKVQKFENGATTEKFSFDLVMNVTIKKGWDEKNSEIKKEIDGAGVTYFFLQTKSSPPSSIKVAFNIPFFTAASRSEP